MRAITGQAIATWHRPLIIADAWTPKATRKQKDAEDDELYRTVIGVHAWHGRPILPAALMRSTRACVLVHSVLSTCPLALIHTASTVVATSSPQPIHTAAAHASAFVCTRESAGCRPRVRRRVEPVPQERRATPVCGSVREDVSAVCSPGEVTFTGCRGDVRRGYGESSCSSLLLLYNSQTHTKFEIGPSTAYSFQTHTKFKIGPSTA